MQVMGNEVHLVRFIVMNLTNLICALAWASGDAIEQNILVLEQAHVMLGAVLARVKEQARNEAAR